MDASFKAGSTIFGIGQSGAYLLACGDTGTWLKEEAHHLSTVIMRVMDRLCQRMRATRLASLGSYCFVMPS